VAARNRGVRLYRVQQPDGDVIPSPVPRPSSRASGWSLALAPRGPRPDVRHVGGFRRPNGQSRAALGSAGSAVAHRAGEVTAACGFTASGAAVDRRLARDASTSSRSDPARRTRISGRGGLVRAGLLLNAGNCRAQLSPVERPRPRCGRHCGKDVASAAPPSTGPGQLLRGSEVRAWVYGAPGRSPPGIPLAITRFEIRLLTFCDLRPM